MRRGRGAHAAGRESGAPPERIGPTQAFKRIKQVFNEQPANRLPDQLALEASLQEELGDTKDFAEGVLAFRGKRSPHFCGE